MAILLERKLRSSNDGINWTAWETYNFETDTDGTANIGAAYFQTLFTVKDSSAPFRFQAYLDGVLSLEMEQDSVPKALNWANHSTFRNVLETCGNIPDGQALLACIVVDGDGQKVAAQKSFQFDTSGYLEFDFSELVPSTAGGILGYIVRAGKGFTTGNLKISEHWVGPFGSFPHIRNTYEIDLNEGDKKGTSIIPHWAVALGDNNLPVYWLGKVSINGNFAPLPECLYSVEPDQGGEIDDDILEEVVIPPGVEEPIVPEYPEPPIKPNPHDPIIKPVIPVPPATGCECEIYVGLQIQRLADILVDLHNDKMSFEQEKMEYLGEHFELIEEELSSIAQWLNEEASALFRLEPCEPEYPDGETITQVAKEFVENYEPPLVEVLENEVVVNSDVDKVYSRNHF